MKYLGLDGGGTHLRATVIDNEKVIYSKKLNKGVNLTSNTEKHIKETFLELKNDIDEIEHICASFSGAGTIKRKELLKSILNEIFKSKKITIYHDAEGILHSSVKKRGTVVISGTGSVVFAKNGEQLKRSGGWGHLFSDKCSGYWFGLRVIQEIFNYRDDLRENDEIFEKLLNHFSTKEIEDLTDLQNRKDFKTYIASFSKVIFSNITPLVKSIIEEGLNDLIPRCQQMMNFSNSSKVYVHGGVFNSEYFMKEFKSKLKNAEIDYSAKNIDYNMALIAKRKAFEEE